MVSSILAGDTVKAACASVAVAQSTYTAWLQRGSKAIDEARQLTGEDDMEGALWFWIEQHGGPANGSPKAAYWSADAPEWWPSTLVRFWSNAVFVVMVYWARGQSERIYRQAITNAATGGDWKAAEFMLTHSFGWRKADRLELTGEGGGPVQVQGDSNAALQALEALARRRRDLERDEDEVPEYADVSEEQE